MKRSLALAGLKVLLVIMILITVLPAVSTAAEQPAATLSPHPTTLGQTTEKVNTTFLFMVVGACITIGGGLLVFRRYNH